MAVRYPALGDFCETAAQILGTTPNQIARFPNIGMAESALAAPRAGFDKHEAYPRLEQKAAILLERLARNHPLHRPCDAQGVVLVRLPMTRADPREPGWRKSWCAAGATRPDVDKLLAG